MYFQMLSVNIFLTMVQESKEGKKRYWRKSAKEKKK